MNSNVVKRAEAIARVAHAGQVDKAGVDYMEHLLAVSEALVPFGDYLVAAGLLHDILEDTDLTAEDLLEQGVPERIVEIVQIVTRDADSPYTYQEWVRNVVAADKDAAKVKLADNAHNSDMSRLSQSMDAKSAQSLSRRYQRARASLLESVSKEEAKAIFMHINPALIEEL